MSARRLWAWPLVPLYAAGLAVKDGLRAAGVLRTRKLAWPVVSVGSLSAGGAGKTPVVIALAELLRGNGWSVDVLSRGYGREGHGVERVDVAAQPQVLRLPLAMLGVAQDDNSFQSSVAEAAARFGDEPVVIARRAGVPVWVGADRWAAGMAAEAKWEHEQNAGVLRSAQNDKERRVHVLDDGFQHRGLARALDVVLVTEADLEDALLPAGNRREPWRALRRADAVVLREEECSRIEARVRALMREGAALWTVRRTLAGVSAGTRAVGFCAIARPEGFWSMLAEAGCAVAEKVEFEDHHGYTTADVERLVKIAKEHGATGFVTTEKDAVKLTAEMRGRLEEVGPLCVARLQAAFADPDAVMRDVEARLK